MTKTPLTKWLSDYMTQSQAKDYIIFNKVFINRNLATGKNTVTTGDTVLIKDRLHVKQLEHCRVSVQ